MNGLLRDSAKFLLKHMLSQCTDSQRDQFKRMYAERGSLDATIDEAIEHLVMHYPDMISNALDQVQRTLEKEPISKKISVESVSDSGILFILA